MTSAERTDEERGHTSPAIRFAQRAAAIASIALFGLLLLLNVWFLLEYAVDIPYYDDWEQYFQFRDGMTLAEFFELHNEHRILLTRLETWAFLHLARWNIYAEQVVNLLIYLSGVIGLVWFLKRRAAFFPGWVFAAFALFSLSPRIFENHLWAFQSQFHFAWMLAFATVALLFREDARASHAVAAALCAFLATWSFSGGLIASVVIALVYSLKTGSTFLDPAQHSKRRSAVLPAALFLAPTLASVGTWLMLYERPEFHPPLVTPLDRSFWAFFLNMVSNGFGLETISAAWGLIALLLVLVPLLGLALEDPRFRSPDVWAVNTCLLSVLAILAGITLGRAGFSITTSKDSRFAEFSGLLPPLTAAAWSLLLRARRRSLASVLAGLWILCAVAFANEWNFRSFYEPVARSRRAGAACVNAYYFAGGDGLCRDIWWDEPMREMLEYSRSLDLSFYRSMKAAHDRRAPAE